MSNIWLVVMNIKNRHITKLVTQIEANLQDKSIDPN